MGLKKILFKVILSLSICCNMCFTVFAANPIVDVVDTDGESHLEITYNNTITKYVNGTANLLFVNGDIISDADVIIENGTTLVPLRIISEKLNANVNWNSVDKTVEIQKGNVSITVPIGTKYINVNGQTIETGTESRIVNALTYVPLRAIASCFGADVGFYNGLYEVNIIYVHDRNDEIKITEEEAINISEKIYKEEFLPTMNEYTQEVYGKNAIDVVKERFNFKISADLGEYYYITFYNGSPQGLFINKYDGIGYPTYAASLCIFGINPMGEYEIWGWDFG